MNTLIIGMDGQLGSEMMRVYKNAVGTTRRNNTGLKLNLENSSEIENVILKNHPDVVVNAAAITSADEAEAKRAVAYKVNAEAVKHIIHASSSIGAYVVQVSTDYVFDGCKGNYNESDIPNPINFYGLSKLIGDSYTLTYDNAVVIRTSGIFGKKLNFPLFVVKTLKEDKTVKAIDSYYSPISAKRLASVIKDVVEKRYYGILNIAGRRISRYDLANRIKDLLDIRSGTIEATKTIPNSLAKRPYDSSLDISKIKKMTSINVEDIDADILDMANVL